MWLIYCLRDDLQGKRGFVSWATYLTIIWSAELMELLMGLGDLDAHDNQPRERGSAGARCFLELPWRRAGSLLVLFQTVRKGSLLLHLSCFLICLYLVLVLLLLLESQAAWGVVGHC